MFYSRFPYNDAVLRHIVSTPRHDIPLSHIEPTRPWLNLPIQCSLRVVATSVNFDLINFDAAGDRTQDNVLVMAERGEVTMVA